MSKLNISDEERAHILEMHHNQVRKDVYERSGFNEQSNSYITNPDDQEYIRRDDEYKKAHPEQQKGMSDKYPIPDQSPSSGFPKPAPSKVPSPTNPNPPGMVDKYPIPDYPEQKTNFPPTPPKSGTGVNKRNSSVYDPTNPDAQTSGTGNNVKPVTPVPPVTSKQNMPGSGSDMVKQIQDKLNGLGIKVVSDGKLGPATLQAVLSALSRLGSSSQGKMEPIASRPVGKVSI